MSRVRAIQWGPAPAYPYYVRFTPNFGFGLPWFSRDGRKRRLRYARHHGLQIVEWRSAGRWVVARQLLGKSTVRGEVRAEG